VTHSGIIQDKTNTVMDYLRCQTSQFFMEWFLGIVLLVFF